MTTYHEFDQKAVEATYALAKEHQDVHEQTALAAGASLHGASQLSLAAQCIQVKVENGRICLKVPIAGNICLPIPKGFPTGTVAEACLHVCFLGPFPTGVRVTVSIAGKQILSKTFGKC